MRFCSRNNCNNVLITQVKDSEMIYRCLVCFEEYELEDEDTLVIDENIQANDTLYKYGKYLRNAHDDSIVELVEMKCKNKACNETIVNVIKIAQNGQSLYVCPKCKTHFK